MCQVWLSVTKKPPLQPFRSLELKQQEVTKPAIDKDFAAKWKSALSEMRNEGMSFKNVHEHMTDFSYLNSLISNGQTQRSSSNETRLSPENPEDSPVLSREVALPRPTMANRQSDAPEHLPPFTTERVLQLIVKGLNLQLCDLSANTTWQEIGLDSLLAFDVIAQLRAERLQIPATIFSDFPTISGLKESFVDGSSLSSSTSKSPTISTPSHVPANNSLMHTAISKMVIELIAEEAGLQVSEITSATSLADIGFDSLMAVPIVCRLQEQGLNVSVKEFLRSNTIQGLLAHLEGL